jgi:hypothetical protein
MARDLGSHDEKDNIDNDWTEAIEEGFLFHVLAHFLPLQSFSFTF